MDNEQLDQLIKLKAANHYMNDLNSDINKVSGYVPAEDLTKKVIYNVTDNIPTKEVQKVISGSQFLDKLKSLRKAGSKIGKEIPGVGLALGIGSALATGDATAAVPVLNEADAAGPSKGSLEYRYENGEKLTDEEFERMMKGE